MNRTTRTARAARLVAATLTATVAFGISAPVVNAAPDKGQGVVKVTTGKGVEKQGVKAQRKLDRLVTRTDRALVRSVKATRVSRLAVIGGRDTKLTVIENVTADRAAVAAVTTAAEAKQYRAVNYIRVVNVLRQAAKAQAESDALGGNADVDALIASTVEKVLAVTALSPRSDIRSARADLSAAKELVEAMALAAEEPTDGTTTDGTTGGNEVAAGTDPVVA